MELKEIEINVNELELRLDRLRALYDQYFMGFEKLEPQIPRKDVERRFQILRKENIRNTAVRFRLNVAIQKYSTYQSYWQRICRQIEEGTYKRHIQKAKARFGEAGRKRGAGADPDFDIDVDVDLAELDCLSDEESFAKLHVHEPLEPYPSSVAPSTLSPDTQPQAFRPMSVQEGQSRRDHSSTDPAPPLVPPTRIEPPRSPQIRPIPSRADSSPPPPRGLPVSRPAVAAKPAQGELSEDRIRQIYAQYVREKRQRGESTATTTFESVARSLRTSSAKLRGQHDGKDVDFEVAEKDGRTILRPVVK